MSSTKVLKPVFNSVGNRLLCCWDECDRDGYELHKGIYHDHAPHVRCDDAEYGAHVAYVFCCDNHKKYFRDRHSVNGKFMN